MLPSDRSGGKNAGTFFTSGASGRVRFLTDLLDDDLDLLLGVLGLPSRDDTFFLEVEADFFFFLSDELILKFKYENCQLA